MTDTDSRPTGPLARVGQSDSFAGLTRIGILVVGAIITWAGFDFHSALDDIHQNQRAIIALGDRTTHVEDVAANALTSGREFRLWTEGRVNDLTSLINSSGQQINEIDRKEELTKTRVRCLENKTRCPP